MLKQSTAQPPEYGAVAKGLHWLVALLLAAQFVIALTMPDIHRDTQPVGLIAWHLQLGLVVLLLAVLRLLWRAGHPVPLIRDRVPPWQYRSAQATHVALYVLVPILPVLGWANASSHGWTIDLFGVLQLPQLVPDKSPLGHQLGDVHTLLAYGLLGLIGLHVAAALYHHFWLHDRVLERIRPGRR